MIVNCQMPRIVYESRYANNYHPGGFLLCVLLHPNVCLC